MSEMLEPILETHLEPSGPANLLQLRFLELYFESGGRALESMRKAGYQGTNETLSRNASRILRREDAQSWLVAKMRAHISHEEAQSILADICRSSMANFVIPDPENPGRLLFDFTTPQAQENLHTIKKYKLTRQGTVEVELYDKMTALALATKNAHDSSTEGRRAVEALMTMLPPDIRDAVMVALTRYAGADQPALGSGSESSVPLQSKSAAESDADDTASDETREWMAELRRSVPDTDASAEEEFQGAQGVAGETDPEEDEF